MEYWTVEVLLGAGVVLIIVLLGIIFLIPGEKKEKKKDLRLQEELVQHKNDLEQKVSKLTKHIRLMREKILALQKKEKESEKILMVERVRVKKLQEKMSQEREWHKKEQTGVDKRENEFRQLKTELEKIQESFSREHALSIRQEREFKDLKQQNDSLSDHCRGVEMENARLKERNENNAKEMAQLKKEAAELSKKSDDAQWIAKSEYDRVTGLLAEREKELRRMERETKQQ
ncbi:MAG: hypothetical protein JW847_06465 [Candidatus Omnitrophica bacterium]|nr:hypothetical protein [Candidatus Omnitrophota bacterium]